MLIKAKGLARTKCEGDGSVLRVISYNDKNRRGDGAVVRATQVSPQVKFPIDGLTFPLFPGLAHSVPRPTTIYVGAIVFERPDRGLTGC